MAVSALAILLGGVSRAEVQVARAVFDLPSWSTAPLRVLMQAGTRAAIVVVVAILLLIGRRSEALAVGLAGSSAWAVARVLKEVVDRPRPSATALARPLREIVEGNGFPSTHAAVATALVVAVILVVPMPRPAIILFVGLGLATAVARVHLGVHWPLDVIGGAGVGIFLGGVMVSLVRRWAPEDSTV